MDKKLKTALAIFLVLVGLGIFIFLAFPFLGFIIVILSSPLVGC